MNVDLESFMLVLNQDGVLYLEVLKVISLLKLKYI